MITETDLQRFGDFLVMYHVSESLAKTLVNASRRNDGLPLLASLRNSLNRIGSGIINVQLLNFVMV